MLLFSMTGEPFLDGAGFQLRWSFPHLLDTEWFRFISNWICEVEFHQIPRNAGLRHAVIGPFAPVWRKNKQVLEVLGFFAWTSCPTVFGPSFADFVLHEIIFPASDLLTFRCQMEIYEASGCRRATGAALSRLLSAPCSSPRPRVKPASGAGRRSYGLGRY